MTRIEALATVRIVPGTVREQLGRRSKSLAAGCGPYFSRGDFYSDKPPFWLAIKPVAALSDKQRVAALAKEARRIEDDRGPLSDDGAPMFEVIA